MKGARIVWLAPWFRGLAHLYGSELVMHGGEVLVVSTFAHPDPGSPLVPEIVGTPFIKDPRGIGFMRQATSKIRAFGPDVAIVDETWDPRFLLMARLAPRRLIVIHDAQPHDREHQRNGWRQRNIERLRRTSREFIVFSHDVGSQLDPPAARRFVPLTSDVPDAQVSIVSEACRRTDFVLLGRMHPYKNPEIAIRAFREHARGGAYAGDRLVLWGRGASNYADSDELIEVRDEAYSQESVSERLPLFKGNVCVYTGASQSGVLLAAMQSGVATIVSDKGALPEYQAPGHRVIPPHDLRGLRDWFDQAADAGTASRWGAEARAWYEARFSQAVAGAALADVVAGTVRP